VSNQFAGFFQDPDVEVAGEDESGTAPSPEGDVGESAVSRAAAIR